MPVKPDEAKIKVRHLYAQDSSVALDEFVAKMLEDGWELHPASRMISFDGTQGAITVGYIFVKYPSK